MKGKIKFIAGCLTAVFFIPFVITLILNGVGLEKDKIGLALLSGVTGNREAKNTVTMSYSVGTEEMDIDEYIIGVLVPAYDYCINDEFVKTMAVMCRTYIKYCNAKGIMCNADFYTDTGMEERWGEEWEKKKSSITALVEQTRGEYLTCGGEVIYPYFHMLTSGYTRNLREPAAYLCEVVQTEDSLEEGYISVAEFTDKEFAALLKKNISGLYFDDSGAASQLQIIEKTTGGYVVFIQAGNIIVDGDSFCDMLGLASPSFTYSATEGGIRFTVKGQGCGYGLSVAGAKRRAENGTSYREILNYYFENIDWK